MCNSRMANPLVKGNFKHEGEDVMLGDFPKVLVDFLWPGIVESGASSSGYKGVYRISGKSNVYRIEWEYGIAVGRYADVRVAALLRSAMLWDNKLQVKEAHREPHVNRWAISMIVGGDVTATDWICALKNPICTLKTKHNRTLR